MHKCSDLLKEIKSDKDRDLMKEFFVEDVERITNDKEFAKEFGFKCYLMFLSGIIYSKKEIKDAYEKAKM